MIGSFVFALLIQVPPSSQQLAPGTRYDPAIPTLTEVADHDFGEEVTPPDQVVEYMEALAAAAPSARVWCATPKAGRVARWWRW